MTEQQTGIEVNASPPQDVRTKKASRHRERMASPQTVMLSPARHIPHVDFRVGSARCQCGRCGLVFSSVSALDHHQTLTPDGDVQCWEPSSIGMVCRKGIWGAAGSPPVRETRDGSDERIG